MLTAPPPAAAPAVSPRMVWAAVVATTAVQVVMSFAMMTLPAIAPAVAAALAVPASLIGYFISIAYAAGLTACLMAGALVRRFGACRTSQVSLALAGAGCALAVVPDPATLVGAALLLGFGYGTNNPAASHLLVRVAAEGRRNLIFSIKQTGVPLGGVLAGVVAPPLALAFGWQWAPAAVAAGAFALALALGSQRKSWDADRNPAARLVENPFHGLRLVWKLPPLRWLSIGAAWISLGQLCLTTFLVTLLVEDAGFTLLDAGILLSAVQVAGVGGRILSGWAADRVRDGLAVLVVLGALMVIAALLTTAMGPQWPRLAIQATFILFGLSAIGWNGVYMAAVAALSPPDRVGTATGGSLAIIFGGVVVGPSLLASVTAAVGSTTTAFALVVLAAAAGAAGMARARAAARRPASPAE